MAREHVYAYPEPAGYADTRLATADAFYDEGLGQFILPYPALLNSTRKLRIFALWKAKMRVVSRADTARSVVV